MSLVMGAFPAAATGATEKGEFEEAPRYNILAYILPYLGTQLHF